MKYATLVLSFILLPFLSIGQVVDIPDPSFKDYLIGLGIDTNGDGEIQSTEAETVTDIEINDSNIASLEGIKSFANLEVFSHLESAVSIIDLAGMPSLQRFDLSGSEEIIYQIQLQGCPSLAEVLFEESPVTYFEIDLVDLSDCSNLTNLRLPDFTILLYRLLLRNCTSLERLYGEHVVILTELDVTGCTALRSVDFPILMTGSMRLEFENLPSLDSINIGVDLSEGIYVSNTPELTYIRYQQLDPINVIELEIANAPKLEEVYVDAIQLDNFSLRDQPELRRVSLFTNVERNISLVNCPKLEEFETFSTIHRSINLSGARLFTGDVRVGPTTETVNLTDCSAMQDLQFVDPVDTLICNGMSSLQAYRHFWNSGLKVIELDGCFSLEILQIPGSEVEMLDLSDCVALNEVDLRSTLALESVILRNGRAETVMFPDADGSLMQICADAEELEAYEDQLIVDFPGILITENCPFADTNLPFLISGASYLDVNQDSCKTSTQKLPYSKYSIIDEGGFATNFFAKQNGDYRFFLSEGTYTYMPEVLYGTDLFTSYPETSTVEVNSTSQEVVQDFCFISSQDLDIVDVTLIPLGEARPGFDADYRIIFTNTGSIVKDGDIVLEFPDDVLDLVSASPMVSTQEVGLLSWSFEGLIPFETRSIDFTMNLNSPMEDPALGSGSILNYTARVSPIGNVTITSYWSYLNQEVVNSFDPNDKTCLDGDVLNEELVGQSLKYMIRFENTGTADAVNVVVIDTLDPASYDIRSLEVLNASHDLRTEIEGNVVKFIFEDIYLPFEDATNDGYVTFRINTLPDLGLGHDIMNRAGIYFDFNFPIITNTTSTVVSEITAVTDLPNADLNVTYYPNPTTLQVQVDADAPMDELELRTTDGRICAKYTLTGAVRSFTVPLEGVLPGVYMLIIRSGDKQSIGKIVVQ